MKNLLTKKDNNSYTFNLKDFLEIQKKIYDNYLPEVDFMQNINNYFLHIMEEVYEFNTAPNVDEKIGECIDVLMYLGSTLNCFNDSNYINILFNCESMDIKVKSNIVNLDNIIFKLLDLRRIFPERKWHKPFDPNSIDYDERASKVSMYFIDMISMCIKKLLYLTGNDVDIINEKLNEKEEFIINLKK